MKIYIYIFHFWTSVQSIYIKLFTVPVLNSVPFLPAGVVLEVWEVREAPAPFQHHLSSSSWSFTRLNPSVLMVAPPHHLLPPQHPCRTGFHPQRYGS